MSSLSDRIRGIVTPRAGIVTPRVGADPRVGPVADPGVDPIPADEHPAGGHAGPALQRDDVAAVLGGAWRDGVFVVEHKSPPSMRHGREAVGTLAECLGEASAEATLFTGAPALSERSDSKGAPFVFFDLETTGLNGGAGTQAFLVGTGWFDAAGAFVTRQFLLTRYADERPMLDAVAAELDGAGTLVSFNGKSFDAPMLETRYLFHRAPWNGRDTRGDRLPVFPSCYGYRHRLRVWSAAHSWGRRAPAGSRWQASSRRWWCSWGL